MWTWIIVGVVIALAVLLCFLLAVATFSFENYYSKFQEVNSISNSYQISTLEYVNQINQKYFKGRLKVTQCERFEDNYSSGVVSLSNETMFSNSLASLAIVSHELGHARQHATGKALEKEWKMRFAMRICAFFLMPLLIAGAVLGLLWAFKVLDELLYLILSLSFVAGALLIFLFAVILKYYEIKIEKQASDYALEFLREVLSEDEIKICKSLLNSARLTYWAGLIRLLLSWTMLTKESLFKR